MDAASVFDVCIIGAGLSGLAAAHEILECSTDLSILILEARDRVGGKTLSVELTQHGQVVDVGAAWINDTNQSEVFKLSQTLGLRLVVQNPAGKVIQEDIDGSLSTFEYGAAPEALTEKDGLQEMLRIRQLFEDACQSIDIRATSYSGVAHLDATTLEDWVREKSESKTALASVSVWTRAMLGLEPSEMRKDTKDGGQYLRFVEGTQSLSKGLAHQIGPEKISLSTEVKTIRRVYNSRAVYYKICTNVEDFWCKRVILTTPSNLWQSLSFDPPLPETKANFASQTLAGYTNKIMLTYKKPWWRESAGLCGLLQSFKGPITVTRDSSVDERGQFSLTCFLVGDMGRKASKLDQSDRFVLVTRHISDAFGPFCTVEHPAAIIEHEWWKDPFSHGCPVPCMPPGVMSKYYPHLRTSFMGIHFAGTALSFEWKGYMEGAVRSGKRAAEEVIQSLQSSSSNFGPAAQHESKL